jgi:hypothetical protein
MFGYAFRETLSGRAGRPNPGVDSAVDGVTGRIISFVILVLFEALSEIWLELPFQLQEPANEAGLNALR